MKRIAFVCAILAGVTLAMTKVPLRPCDHLEHAELEEKVKELNHRTEQLEENVQVLMNRERVRTMPADLDTQNVGGHK